MSFKSIFFYFSVFMYSCNSMEVFSQETSDSLHVAKNDSILGFETNDNFENSEVINEIISYAKEFLGTPYKYSGTSPLGFDCSGFIYYVMGNFGFRLTHSSYGMAEFGETVMLSKVRPGDLLFFKGRNINSTNISHVAMVIENGPDGIKMIHSSTSRGVVIDNFSKSKYFIPRFLKAKRLDYGVEE